MAKIWSTWDGFRPVRIDTDANDDLLSSEEVIINAIKDAVRNEQHPVNSSDLLKKHQNAFKVVTRKSSPFGYMVVTL